MNRLNRILKYSAEKIPSGTEWWTHYSDWVKSPLKNDSVPIFGIAGSRGYGQVAGIPFTSFSDAIFKRESETFQRMEYFRKTWGQRSNSAFFRGSLSDCQASLRDFRGDVNFCAKAKVILEATKSKNPLTKSIKATTNFRKTGLNMICPKHA